MRGCAPATGINSPRRGVHNPLRASLARSPPRLGRSQAGACTPRPPGLRPWRAFAHRAPAASVTQPEGSGHGCDGGGGGQPLAVVHARRLAPGGFRASGKFQKVGRRKALRGVRGACPRPIKRRWATRPRRWAARVQPQAVPPSTDWARLSTGDRATGQSLRSLEVNRPESLYWRRAACHQL